MVTASLIYIAMVALFWWLAYDSCRRREVDPSALQRIIARWIFAIFWPIMTIIVFLIVIMDKLGVYK